MNKQFQLLIKRFSIALVVSSLCRLLFFVLNPYFYSFSIGEIANAFYFGVLYDISACVYLNLLFIAIHLLPGRYFYSSKIQKVLFALFMLMQFVICFFNLLDTGYFPIAGRRSGIDVLGMINELDGVFYNYLGDYWYLIIALISLVFISYYSYKKTYLFALSLIENDKKELVFTAVFWRVSVLALSFIGARGGYNLLPLNPFDAARQTRAEFIPLVVNTPFNMIISTQQAGLKEKNYFEGGNERNWFEPIQQFGFDSLSVKPKNIVLIIVESLGKEYVGYYNQGRGYTPFLDSLMGHSEVFLHAYSNGKKSIEGIPSILSSMPSWMATPYLGSFYQGNSLKGIGAYLQEMGYDASFYHGGRNGTMSFDNFIATSKGGAYFGKNEYPNPEDGDGHWGIYDMPYLQYFGKELTQKKEPFFSSVFTLSSHHPYKLPADKINSYKKGTMPIHPTIGYVDDALRQFFKYAKTQAWYAHTSFIITADHSAENEKAYYQSAQGKFELPLIVFRPEHPINYENTQTVSHVDVLPMVLKEVGYTKPFFCFGTYAEPSNLKGLALQNHDNYYQLVQWPFVYQFDGQNALGFYNVANDSLLQHNLLKLQNFAGKIDSLEMLSKAIIQTYNRSLIKNNTIAP